MALMGHVARVGEINAKFWSEDVEVDGQIILERVLGKKDRNLRIRFIWLRRVTSGGLF
jgi:hypothetical protein